MPVSDREYVVQHMYEEEDKNIVRKMRSVAKIARIANLIRAIEHMKRHGGVLGVVS